MREEFVASELKDPICHSDECQIGSFSSEAKNHTHRPTSVYRHIIQNLYSLPGLSSFIPHPADHDLICFIDGPNHSYGNEMVFKQQDL